MSSGRDPFPLHPDFDILPQGFGEGWIRVRGDALPPNPSEEVEVLVDYGMVVRNPSHPACGKRHGIEVSTPVERDVRAPLYFWRDLTATGIATHWRRKAPPQ